MNIEEFRKEVHVEVVKALAASKLSEAQITELRAVFDGVLDEKMRPLRADMLALAQENKQIKDALSTGKGLQKNDNVLDRNELKAMLPQRIESASLREIVNLIEGKQ